MKRPAVKQVLLWAIVLGAVLRLALAAANLFHPSAALAYVQADNYAGAANVLRQTHDTTDPVFVPGYIFVVAAFQACFGRCAHAVLLLFQCILGVACIPMMFAVARRMGGEVCGAIAATLVAIDPLLVTRSSLIMTEAVYIPLLLAALLLFVKAMTDNRGFFHQWIWIALCSLCMGAAILVRTVGVLLPFIGILVLSFTRSMAFRRKAIFIFTTLTVCLAMIFPLCLHNLHKYGKFSVSSSAGFNYAALIVGPAKRMVDRNDGPGLLAMWRVELGDHYEDLPPFVLAERAARVAWKWSIAHPGITAHAIVRGQLVMLVAPDRSA